MTGSLVFLILLLMVVVGLNWRLLASRFGWRVRACNWQRVHKQDREGRRAWFCTACGRSEFVEGKGPPPDCGAKIGGR